VGLVVQPPSLLEPIGYIPPAEAEANYWRQQQQRRATAATASADGAATPPRGLNHEYMAQPEASGGPCGELEERRIQQANSRIQQTMPV
jgi:hypothetical protein